MGSLTNKQVLLGVTGGIAAYKSADLVRRLADAGATVKVVMTKAACEFVSPLTFQAVSGHPVHTDLLDPDAEAGMGHIELARWADFVLVAPATADFMARYAAGLASDLLGTVIVATQAPVFLAPAMNSVMWANAATQANLETLISRDVEILGPGVGDQACGETGPGRMLEPTELVAMLGAPRMSGEVKGKQVVVTAGPTLEDLDPVRFLGNRSSGKMGFAIAAAAARAGADVLLISGPVKLGTPPGVRRQDVRSARDMLAAVLAAAPAADVLIMAAAVADFRPADYAEHKIKKKADTTGLTLELDRNPDILMEVAKLPQRPFTVGFAAETDNVVDYARGKLRRKGLNLIAANQVGGADCGFDVDTNALTLIWEDGEHELPHGTKVDLAAQLVRFVSAKLDTD